jgi:hypothetical protein
MSDSVSPMLALPRNGGEVEIVIHPHGFDDAMEVLDMMVKLGIGGIISMVLSSTKIKEGETDPESRLEEARSSLDPEAITTTLIEGLERSGGLRRMAPLLLKYARANGDSLSDPEVRNRVFMRHYGDLTKVLRRVIDYNGFFEALSTAIA